MKIIAHRGGAGLGLENTLSCIEKGLETGPDMVEIDVHLTADGEVVVCHDPYVDRTTDGKGRISEMSLKEIKALHIKDKRGHMTDEKIPSLREVMDLVGERAVILLEIKKNRHSRPDLEEKVTGIIREYDAADRVIIQSFDRSTLEKVNALAPEIRLEKLMFIRPFCMKRIKEDKLVSSYNIWWGGIGRRGVKMLHKAGKKVRLWTLTSPDQLKGREIDGAITDRPDLFTK